MIECASMEEYLHCLAVGAPGQAIRFKGGFIPYPTPISGTAKFADAYGSLREAYRDLLTEDDFLPLNSKIDLNI